MKRFLISLVSILSFAALSANQDYSISQGAHFEHFFKVSKTCDFSIKKWDELVAASNPDNAIFSGNVLFQINNKNYKTTELYVKNFYKRKNCEVKSDLVIQIK